MPPENSRTSQQNITNRKSIVSSSHDDCPTSCRCSFFVWDFVSYYLYKMTMRQVRENTFEGKGGKKFIRIQSSNKALETLYPQLRAGELKKDGCLVCEHSWKEHLEYWWWCQRRRQRGVQSAFEQCLEQDSIAHDGGGKSTFHKKYVGGIHSSKQKDREVRQNIFDEEVAYSVPKFNPLADGRPKSITSVLLLSFARTASLMRLDDLILLSGVESMRSEREQQESFS